MVAEILRDQGDNLTNKKITLPLQSARTLVFQWYSALAEFDRAAWQRLSSPYNLPFLDWDWLNLLETSGCVGGDTGWVPLHLGVQRSGRLVAAAALYVKYHSRGEFVFDQPIAEISEQLNLPYYPKLLGMSPFTPATGYRFLIDQNEDELALCGLMLEEINTMCEKQNFSGCHFLRVDPHWGALMSSLGLSRWLHHALIWENRGYANFDDYLASFRSKRRKSIRRERLKQSQQAVRLITVPGLEAREAWFERMYDFYAATCQKFLNMSHYLNPRFFHGLAGNLANHIVFVAAFEGNDEINPVALSMLVRAGEQLYGRYWGSENHYEHLHFEACYYQPIQWAIANDIRFFDAGSGNARHKRQRGFLAQPSFSLHRFYQPMIDGIWRANADRINQIEQRHINAINTSSRSA